MERVVAKPLTNVANEERAKVIATAKDYTPTEKRAHPKKLWDNYEDVAVIQKSDRLRFNIAACTREGYRCINIREFYYVKRDDAWKPGRDGLIIPVAAPLHKTRRPDPNNPPKLIYPLQDLLCALEQAMEIVKDMPLEDPDKEVWLLPRIKVEVNE